MPVSVVGRALPELRAIALVCSRRDAAGRHDQSDHPDREPGHGRHGPSRAAASGPGGLGHAQLHPGKLDRRALHGRQYSVGLRKRQSVGNFQTFAQNNVNPPSNVVTITGSPVTLPTSPATYYLGVVVDPNGKIHQLSLPSNRLQLEPQGWSREPGLPPAGVVNSGNTESVPERSERRTHRQRVSDAAVPWRTVDGQPVRALVDRGTPRARRSTTRRRPINLSWHAAYSFCAALPLPTQTPLTPVRFAPTIDRSTGSCPA